MKLESPIELWFYNIFTKKFKNIKILSQQHIGKYRVDFLIPSTQTIIECEGKQFHQNKEKDWKRQFDLERAGYTVLRFTGSEIYHKQDKDGHKIIDIVKWFMDNPPLR